MPSVGPGNLNSYLEGYGTSDSEEPQTSGLASHVGAYGSDSDMEVNTSSEAEHSSHPLALNIAATEPYRLQNQLGPNPDSPQTPTDAADRTLFERYSQSSTLPPPHDNPSKNFVSFGAVEVPREAAAEYQQLREHAIQSRAGAKTLFAAEQTLTRPQEDGSQALVDRVRVYPYQPGINEIEDLDGGTTLDAKDSAFYSQNDANETIGNVTFNARRGLFTQSGGQQSAATGGLHELRHLVVDPGTGKPMPGFTGEQEHQTIINAENPVARANGEEPRDTHGDAGHYETNSIRSTIPIDPRTREVIDRYKGPLREATARMDQHNLGAGHVDHPDVIARRQLAHKAASEMKIFERRRHGDTGLISSAGNSDRSGNSVASSDDAHFEEASDVEEGSDEEMGE